VEEIIDFLGLTPHKHKAADELSSGFRRTLAVGVAIAAQPRLLLLDEPVTTMSADRVEMIMQLVRKLRDSGTTVAIIEHNMKAIMDHCDRIAVLAFGQKLAEGRPDEVKDNKEVVEAYLGEMM
jgi:branched-chain amino acid transport system ATP-binding protein